MKGLNYALSWNKQTFNKLTQPSASCQSAWSFVQVEVLYKS
jgi:hypothetical protein